MTSVKETLCRLCLKNIIDKGFQAIDNVSRDILDFLLLKLTTNTLRSFLSKTRPKNDIQSSKNCIYSIPCECNKYYVGKTSRPTNVRVEEHKNYIKRREFEKSKICEHAWEYGHLIQWGSAKMLEKEDNATKRKLKETTVILLNGDKCVSNCSVNIDHCWLQLYQEEKFRGEGNGVICNSCRRKLNAALEFKCTCLNTNKTIIPHVDCKEILQLELGKAYLEENKSAQLTGTLHDHKICRLCMQLINGEIRSIGEEELEAIHRFIPELYMRIATDPVLCKPCFDSLAPHNAFLRDCLEVDQSITDIFESSAPESRAETTLSDFFVKNETEIKEEEMSIKTECVDIKSENDEEVSDIHPNNEVFEYSDCKDAEEERLKHMWKPKDKSIEKCNLDTRKKSSFTFHEFTSSSPLYKCDKCIYEPGNVSITTHCVTHKNVLEVYKCETREFETKHQKSLIRHRFSHKEPLEVQIFKCKDCDYETNHKRNVYYHAWKHKDPSQVPMYKCDACDYETKYKSSLARHVLQHKDPSQVQMYKCDACDYESRYKKNLISHQLTHKDPSELQMYQCNECNYKSKYRRSLACHVLQHKNFSQLQTHKCDICDYQTKYKSSLVRHVLQHKDPSQVQMYKCDACDYESRYKKNLTSHQLTHKYSQQLQMYQCNECDYKSKYKTILACHVLQHKDPSQAQMYKCNDCDYKTNRKRNINYHARKHKDPSQVQMYKCDVCDYESRYKDYFTAHQLTHKDRSEVQMYKCNYCDYEAKYRSSLARHVLQHEDTSQMKTYKCNDCDYTSIHKSHVNSHAEKHKDSSQVQMYKCDACDYKSRYKHNLTKHQLLCYKDGLEVQI